MDMNRLNKQSFRELSLCEINDVSGGGLSELYGKCKEVWKLIRPYIPSPLSINIPMVRYSETAE